METSPNRNEAKQNILKRTASFIAKSLRAPKHQETTPSAPPHGQANTSGTIPAPQRIPYSDLEIREFPERKIETTLGAVPTAEQQAYDQRVEAIRRARISGEIIAGRLGAR